MYSFEKHAKKKLVFISIELIIKKKKHLEPDGKEPLINQRTLMGWFSRVSEYGGVYLTFK